MNKFEREQICEPNTNKMSWKKAKELLESQLPDCMANYKTFGEKKDEFKAYQCINYIERIIEPFNQEDVDAYHQGLGKLFKWLKMAIGTRKQDIIRRKAIYKRNKEEKTSREEAKATREANREQYLVDKEAEYNEANKDDIEAYRKWEEEQQRLAEQDYGEEAGTDDEEEKGN